MHQVQRNTSANALVLLAAAIMLAGCSPKYVGRAYDGSPLKQSAVATVLFDDAKRVINNQSVRLSKVDGASVQMSVERAVDLVPANTG
jgi:hypothetical protein